MRAMNNLEYSYTIRELSPLIGKRFDRIFKVKGGYRLKIGDAQIIIIPGTRLHRTKYLEEPEEADGFVQKARSELDNSRLQEIIQLNNDRIIEFAFERAGVRTSLVFEMFAKGNCILVRDGITLAAMREESWSGREIRRRREYSPPKQSTVQNLADAISEKYIISCMMKLPLGKEYSTEILKQCSIDEQIPGNTLDDAQVRCLEEGVRSVSENAKPCLFIIGGKPADFGLFPFSKYGTPSPAETLGDAMDSYYWENRGAEAPKTNKLEKRLAEQEQRLVELERLEQEYREKGDAIYSHFEELDRLSSLSKKHTLDELEKVLKAEINKKEKSLELEL